MITLDSHFAYVGDEEGAILKLLRIRVLREIACGNKPYFRNNCRWLQDIASAIVIGVLVGVVIRR